MIYIEDSLAGIVRCAAGLGRIPGLDESGIFTDENAGNEWEGAGKVYAVRGEATSVYDVTSVTGNAECEISEIGLVSIAPQRRTAQETASAVWASVLCKFGGRQFALDYAGSEPVDFTAEVRSASSLFRLGEEDAFHLGAADSFKASAFGWAGTVSGTGAWIGGALFAESVPDGTRFYTSALGVIDWILDRYTTVPRAGDGAYRDEWFSTHTIRVIHTI